MIIIRIAFISLIIINGYDGLIFFIVVTSAISNPRPATVGPFIRVERVEGQIAEHAMKQLEVGTEYIHNLLQLVQARGGRVEQLFATADLPYDPHSDDNEKALDAAGYSRLYSAAIELDGDECFGFFGPGRVPCGTFSIFCEYILPARTLAEALQRASTFFNWMQKLQHRNANQKPHIAYTTGEDIATLYFINQSSAASPVFITQRAIASGFSSWHCFLGWLIGTEIPLLEVHFQGRCQLDETRYRRIFKAPLRYQQQSNACLVSAHLLQAPIVHSQESLEDFMRLAPYHLVGCRERDSRDDSISNRVKQLLGDDFSKRLPGTEKIAKALSTSARNLRLGLEKEGTCLQTLKDEARLQAAIALLREPTPATSDIAKQMGFDDAGAFQRAFKKWTGLDPEHYRQQLA
jgi:AraC-like DNA-binding protein